MKPGIGISFLLGIVTVVASSAAAAEPGDGRWAGRSFDHRPDDPGPVPMRPVPGHGEQAFRRDEFPPPGRMSPGHMSPEERRQLRHDIRRAGDDIYRRQPRHR